MKEYERLTKKGKKWIESNHDEVEAYNRLAELENKIKDGTLIELPRIIHPNKAEWYVQYQYPNGVIQYYICFSEADAKEILKELQEK